MGPTPLRPATQADQKASLPTPLGATTPSPVTTTLRMDTLRRGHDEPPGARPPWRRLLATVRWVGWSSGDPFAAAQGRRERRPCLPDALCRATGFCQTSHLRHFICGDVPNQQICEGVTAIRGVAGGGVIGTAARPTDGVPWAG